MERDTYTVAEAAKLMGIHQQTLWKRIKKGLIPGAEKNGRFFVIWKQPFDEWRRGERKAAA